MMFSGVVMYVLINIGYHLQS